jgi:hypothetical protein
MNIHKKTETRLKPALFFATSIIRSKTRATNLIILGTPILEIMCAYIDLLQLLLGANDE